MQDQAQGKGARSGALAVIGAVAAGALVWGTELVLSLILMHATQFEEVANSRGATMAAIRLALVAAFGVGTIALRNEFARWTLVIFFSFWSVERIFWASRGNLTAVFVAPIFVACAIVLSCRVSSRFMESAV